MCENSAIDLTGAVGSFASFLSLYLENLPLPTATSASWTQLSWGMAPSGMSQGTLDARAWSTKTELPASVFGARVSLTFSPPLSCCSACCSEV